MTSQTSVYPGVPDELCARVDAIAAARGETPAQVIARFSTDDLARAPKSFSKHMGSLRKTRFEEAGVRDGLAYVRLPDGKVFYSYISQPNHQRAFEFVSDTVPDGITAETYLISLDIAHRYATDFSWPPAAICPPKGGVIVECGAYLGHKTVRFAEELVGREGKVLAIEMMPDNVEILRRNVSENGLDGVIEIVEAGVWNAPGTLPVKGKGRQRNSLLEIDKIDVDRDVEVRVDRLDTLIAEWGVPMVDLVFMTINGAEIEAVEGLDPDTTRIKGLFVAAPYERDGRSNAEICREKLIGKGFDILPESGGNRVFAVNPRI